MKQIRAKDISDLGNPNNVIFFGCDKMFFSTHTQSLDAFTPGIVMQFQKFYLGDAPYTSAKRPLLANIIPFKVVNFRTINQSWKNILSPSFDGLF